MKTSSAKAKGRRLCQELQEALLKCFPELEEDDIRVTPSGCTGSDLMLSPKAKRLFPYSIECKNQESLQIWKALLQAATHKEAQTEPLLVFRRNHSRTYACLELDTFLRLIAGKKMNDDGDNRRNNRRKKV